MFDVDKFMNSASSDEVVVVRRGSEDFKIRRMNGAERLVFNDVSGVYKRVVYVLSHCLLTGEQNQPIGDENAAKLIQKFGALAEGLFEDVVELTQKSLDEETKVWELAKKNTGIQTDTNASSDNSAAATA